MTSNQLLVDFLTTDLPLTELAQRHGLTLPDLLAWADAPETARIFDDLQRIAARRSALIAAESSAKALANLAQLSLALAKRSELANLGGAGGPRPPSITALESSRKACAALLRIHQPSPRQPKAPRGRGEMASSKSQLANLELNPKPGSISAASPPLPSSRIIDSALQASLIRPSPPTRVPNLPFAISTVRS